MFETPNKDISEATTIPAVPATPPNVPPMPPMDFGPLIDDTDDFDLTSLPVITRPRRRRWIMWLVIGLLVILLSGGGIFTYMLVNRPTPVQYTQVAVTMGNLNVTVSGSGPVGAKATYNLNFSSSATSAAVKTISVSVGQQVKKGDLLATLDPTALQNTVTQAQQAVNADQTALNQANTNLSDVKNQEATAINIAFLNEQKSLSACSPSSTPGTTPTPAATATPTPTPDTAATATAESNCKTLAEDTYTQAVQQADATMQSAQNTVTGDQQKLTADQTTLQQDKDALQNASLVAPANGTIESINGEVGVPPSSGSSAFIVLVDTSTLSIAAEVNEADIASVAVNQPATFTLSAYSSQTFRASVTSINPQGASSSNVVTYTVNLAVDQESIGSAHIYPGMTATVNISTAERIGTLLVPAAALSFSTTAIQDGELSRSALSSLTSQGAPSTSGSRGIVVELQNGKLVPVLVTTGLTNGQETEILSGLKAGDQVVVGQTGGKASSNSPGTNGSGPVSGGPVGVPASGGSGAPVLCSSSSC